MWTLCREKIWKAMTLESICYQIWLMTQFQRDESHADPSTFFAATGLDCGVSLDLRSGSCSMHTRWTRSSKAFVLPACSLSKYPCDSMWFNMMGYDGYDVRCNQSVVTSGFVLLAQRLSFRGAVHICNERSRAAVELIHQLVPIRFQLLAVAWYNRPVYEKDRKWNQTENPMIHDIPSHFPTSPHQGARNLMKTLFPAVSA